MKKSLALKSAFLLWFLFQLLSVSTTLNAAQLSEFEYTQWQFGRADGSVIAHKIKLLPGGKIEGYYHPNEDHWGVEGDYLVFYHKSGKPSCRFTLTQTENGKRVLSGQFLFLNNVTHVLKEKSTVSAVKYFTGTTWQFTRGDGFVIANTIRLLPGGKIEGYYHPNEDHWGTENGYLVFYHKSGKPSCRFTLSKTENGRKVLSGQFLFHNNITHVLKEIW